MTDDPTRVEIITGHARRRRYTANEKLALVDATMQPGMTVSNPTAPSLSQRFISMPIDIEPGDQAWGDHAIRRWRFS